jgi:hypothetical protein
VLIGIEWPIILVVASLAGVVGLLAAGLWRGRAGGPMVDALATGVLVGLLVGMVPRLTSSAMVVLARLLSGLQPELRSQAGTIGPVIIQNLATALVIGVYLVSMWLQRRRQAPPAEHLQSASVFALTLGVYALANGLATGSGSLPLTLSTEVVGGVVLAHICRGLALGGASSGALPWLVAAAVLGGPLGFLGTNLARGLGFETASLLAVPVLVGAVGLVVLLIAHLVGPGLGSGLRRLPVTGFLAGLGLTLLSARLIGSNF